MVGCESMLYSLIDRNVSEEPPASIFRVEISILFVARTRCVRADLPELIPD